jgi:DNA-damage-inducible protein J
MSHIHVRVKDDTKKAAKEVFDRIGLDMSSAITIFLKQVSITQSIPFPLLTENGFTIQQEREILEAEKEAKKGVNTVRTNNKEELKEFLKSLKNNDDHRLS